ncbi:hypothetical protein F31_0044 [Escherichia phage vB_Eco_F31]|nr:hypothetical protein F31_0044 [Escherichia phage vB_Eco_F31]
MISRKSFNYKLNEEILTIKLNTNEQILKKALMGLFETKAAKVIKEPVQLEYYADAFLHSVLGSIDAEALRYINTAKKFK